MNRSLSSLARRVMSGSSSFICFGPNSGSSSRRYFRCSGGSMFSGIKGEERVELEDPFGGNLVVAHRTTSKRV